MEKLLSYKINTWPFKGFTYVGDLIDFDGPLLVHYIKGDCHAFYYWVEGDNNVNRWLCFEVTLIELYDYMQANISLFELILNKSKEPFYITDIDANLKYSNFQMLVGYSIPDSYIPDKESFYVGEIGETYEGIFKELTDGNSKKQYLEFVRKRALDLVIKSNNAVFGGTISAEGAGSFLNNTDHSYKAYGAYRFYNENKDKISNLETLSKATKQFVDNMGLRIADNGHSSFKVTLSADILGDTSNMPVEYIDLRKKIIEDYKRDVLDKDLNDDKIIDELIAKYDPLVRKKIFDPLIKVINSNEYDLTVINKKSNTSRSIRKVNLYNKKRLIPPREKIDEAPSDLNKVLLTITIEVDEKHLSTISKKDIEQGTLFSRIGRDTTNEIQKLEGDEFDVIFAKPISIVYRANGSQIEMEFEPLKIKSANDDKDIAFNQFMTKFFAVIKSDFLAKNPSNVENQKYLQSIIYDIIEKN